MNLRHNHEITSRRLKAYLLPTPPGGPKSQKKSDAVDAQLVGNYKKLLQLLL